MRYDRLVAPSLPTETPRLRVLKYRITAITGNVATLEIPGSGGGTTTATVPVNLAETIGAGQWAHCLVQAGVVWIFATDLIEET